jgi:hypothetical protein
MSYRSFDEWSKDGFQIIKGSKATWVDNKPVFSDKQVVLAIFVKEDCDWEEEYDPRYEINN